MPILAIGFRLRLDLAVSVTSIDDSPTLC